MSTPLVDEVYIDGKFIKISKCPKLDFLKFVTPDYPFYSLFENICNEPTIRDLALKEITNFRTCKRLNKYSTVYRALEGFIYTHYGSSFLGTDSFHFLKEFRRAGTDNLNFTSIPEIKRIDLAYDLYGIDLVDLIKNSLVHSKRKLTIQFLSYGSDGVRIYKTDPNFHDNITTFYAGKVNSKVSICIYKRHLKLNVTGPISRIEIRFKGHRADELYQELTQYSEVRHYNRILSHYLHFYLAFKILNSSKSTRLNRYKNMPWWDDFLAYLSNQ